MYITEHVLGATSKDSSVKMDQIIAKGIELGVVEDYPRGKEGDHPWFPRASIMIGVVDNETAAEHEEPHFHREKMKKIGGGSAMFYWVDWKHYHKKVYRDEAALELRKQKKLEKEKQEQAASLKQHLENIKEKEQAHNLLIQTGGIVEINGKKVLKSWIQQNPDKAYKLYGSAINEFV